MENSSIEIGGKYKDNKKGYEAFDPDEELKKIKKFSQKGKKTTPERLRLKKSLIKKYHQELADQKMGIAEINAGLEKVLPDSMSIERDELEKFLAEKAKEYKLSKQQIDNYRKVFDKAEKKNRIIKEFTEKYKNRPKDFFEDTFGKKPLGEVIVESSAISVAFICKDVRDYAWAYRRVRLSLGSDDELDKNDIKHAKLTAGFAIRSGTKIEGLDGSVTVIDASLRSEYKDTIIHEEKHVVQFLIKDIFFENSIGDLKSYEERGGGEILAFLKEGRSIELIKSFLFKKKNEDGIYDYLSGEREPIEKERDRYNKLINLPEHSDSSDLIELFKKVYKGNIKLFEEKEKTYYKHLENALACVDKLEKTGFSRDKIIGLFQTEELAKWPKVYERIKQSKEFKDKLRKKIQEIKKDLDDHKRKAKNKILDNFDRAPSMWDEVLDGDFYDYPSKSRQEKQYLQKIYNEYINQIKYANNPDIIAQAEECKKTIEYIEETFNNIKNGLTYLRKLEGAGFNRDEIIELFQAEELADWPKIYERIGQAKKV